MRSAALLPKPSTKPFIVDLPAKLTRRNPELSKHARELYTTMRGMADGKTGALKIKGGRWLNAKVIDAAAEICRDVRMRAMRELVALGLVTMERERVERIIHGRRRVVLGAVHYYVHRQPVTPRSARPFLLQSILSTVEEIDPQSVSNPPLGALPSSVVPSLVSSQDMGTRNHHHQQPKPNDDDDLTTQSLSLSFLLTDEDVSTIRAVRENLRRDHPDLAAALKLEEVHDDWFSVAMDAIERRGQGKISSPAAYFTTALRNLFANILDKATTQGDDTLVQTINEEFERRLQRRAKWGITAQPVTMDSEARRQTYLARRGEG